MLHDMGRLVVLTNTDIYMHTGARTTEDLVAFHRREHERVLGYAAPPDLSNTLAAFEHVASDYDARYFGYLWSQMAATDIFRQFTGDSDAATGVRYRKRVLEPGAKLDGAKMIRSFLGRDPCPSILLSLLE
jgi:Zn-dependent oligopeptidase